MNAVDLLVDTENPAYLDQSVQHFGAAVVGGGMPGGYTKHDGHYIVRVFGDPGFVEFAIKNQGYGTVVGRLDQLV